MLPLRLRRPAVVATAIAILAHVGCGPKVDRPYIVQSRWGDVVCITGLGDLDTHCGPALLHEADPAPWPAVVGRAADDLDVGSCFVGSTGHPSSTVHFGRVGTCPVDPDLSPPGGHGDFDLEVRFDPDGWSEDLARGWPDDTTFPRDVGLAYWLEVDGAAHVVRIEGRGERPEDSVRMVEEHWAGQRGVTDIVHLG